MLAVSFVGFLKPIIERRQQYYWSPWFPNQHEGFLTYPSGHVAGAAACATFAWFVLSRHTRLAALAFVVHVPWLLLRVWRIPLRSFIAFAAGSWVFACLLCVVVGLPLLQRGWVEPDGASGTRRPGN